jgi:hypothetical protein
MAKDLAEWRMMEITEGADPKHPVVTLENESGSYLYVALPRKGRPDVEITCNDGSHLSGHSFQMSTVVARDFFSRLLDKLNEGEAPCKS